MALAAAAAAAAAVVAVVRLLGNPLCRKRDVPSVAAVLYRNKTPKVEMSKLMTLRKVLAENDEFYGTEQLRGL